jgi:hypothetical protein
MKDLIRLSRLAVLGILLAFGGGMASAQQPGWQNMDPQQMQQMMQQRLLSNIREQMQVTDDKDWDGIEPSLTKVAQGYMSAMMARMGAMMGGGVPSMGEPDPDTAALQAGIDNNAPPEQMKALLEKFRQARDGKAAEQKANEEQLRQILTPRQEAVLVLMGILS